VHYAPFNLQAVGSDVVVTYVLHQEGAQFETDGPGIDFVDIFSSAGLLLRQLERGDWLNAPWGLTLAPLDFGRFSHDLPIGQFAGARDTGSSGFIAADLTPGKGGLRSRRVCMDCSTGYELFRLGHASKVTLCHERNGTPQVRPQWRV
jgi:hypothetical protein